MPDQDEMLRHVEELFGYSIQTRRNLKVFVLIVGPGDNGKGTIIKLFVIILGNDAIAFDRLAGVDERGNRFATARLVGKQLLIDDDVDHEYLLPDGLIKKIAEEKPLTAENKFHDPFPFIAQIVLWLLGNSWPRSRDLTRGMQTRSNVLFLPRVFLKPSECGADHPNRQRPELWEKVYTEEMPGVLNRFIDGYYRVAERGGFLPPPSAKCAFDMWLAEANVVSRFVEEACDRIEPEKPGCTTSMLYGAFKEWATANGVQERHRPQQNQMKKRLEEIGLRVKHVGDGTGVFGIRPRQEWTQHLIEVNPFAEKPPNAKDTEAKIKKAQVPGIEIDQTPIPRAEMMRLARIDAKRRRGRG
jgi:P4 family phage/plasmid primase-like protien